MRELVGYCSVCKKEIFCRDGFLDGVVDSNGNLLCFDCSNNEKSEK